jgi:hypothetical protein
MANKLRLVELAMVPPLAQEVASQIDGAVAAKAAVVALTTNTVTATTGTLPTPDGATTIANAATPTVVELLELCMELKAKVDAIRTALKA